MKSFRTRAPWTAVDFVLLALVLAAGLFTILAAVFSSRSNMLRSGHYRKHEARVSDVSKATTRCDTCVNRFVGHGASDRDDVDDDVNDSADAREDADDDVNSLVDPDWWVDILNDPEEQQQMEDECPLLPALYVTVTYKDKRGRQRKALLHKNVEMKEQYSKLSFSRCERMDDMEEQSRRSRDRRSADGSATSDNKGMREVMTRFQKLLVSGKSLSVYVDPEHPDQAVDESPNKSLWTSKPFSILFAITIILLAAFVIRRCVMLRKAQKVDDVTKKSPPEVAAVGRPEVIKRAGELPSYEVNQERKEKDPAALGPEVYAVPYNDVILHQYTLMTRGLADDVKMTNEMPALPPVYGVETSVDNTPPPTYSSLDLRKY